MSDEPFRPPGSRPGGTDVHPDTRPWVWDEADDEAVPVLFNEASEPPEAAKRGRTDLAVTAALGIVVGVVGTVFALNAGNGTSRPVEITPETFPREVMSLLRTDLLARDLQDEEHVQLLDEYFARQLEGYRFAYGGDGATMYYSVGGSGVEYTIVNGILPPDLPHNGTDAGLVAPPVLVSFEEEMVLCTVVPSAVVMEPMTGEAAAPEMDAVSGLSSCVLRDETRNLSQRLSEVGVPRNAARSAEQLAAELQRLYADLTS